MNIKTLIAIAIASAALTGCENINTQMAAQSGVQAIQAATLSDADARSLANQSCKELDSQSQIASSKSKYTKRLNKIAKAMGNNINGLPVNYKVYMTDDINAFAMANGCIRVYSSLMDMMTDDEIEGVLGHEMGHVALGHSLKAMKVAYGTIAARTAVASTSGVAAELSQTQLADLGEALINSQFSQHQESEADDFSYDFLKKHKLNTLGLATSFEKLAELDGGRKGSMFDSHPPSTERAQHIRDRIAADK
ncbi:M48 family metallopeptidase [Hafnia alvei]|jgi:putative metalloprotease|nr:metalloprotease [Hafnia alvei]NEY28905.1 M48 family metallopeptidase [Escherichia coli]MBI0278336.1 M48 family metallopeptidase [Hafnia alvei]PNK97749.1 metalloprotease [Hafnia alvei]TBL85560.1 metalloprotease [Hafnia alvei]